MTRPWVRAVLSGFALTQPGGYSAEAFLGESFQNSATPASHLIGVRGLTRWGRPMSNGDPDRTR
jgi:hypothetical protein